MNDLVGSVVSFLIEGAVGSGIFYMGRLMEFNNETHVSMIHCPVGVQTMPDGVMAFGEIMPLATGDVVAFSSMFAVAKPVMPLVNLYETYVEKIHPMCAAALLKDVTKSYGMLANAGKDDLERIKDSIDNGEPTPVNDGIKRTLN